METFPLSVSQMAFRFKDIKIRNREGLGNYSDFDMHEIYPFHFTIDYLF
jgi:hypothetical protein